MRRSCDGRVASWEVAQVLHIPVGDRELAGAVLAILLLKAAIWPLQHHWLLCAHGVQSHAVLPRVDHLHTPMCEGRLRGTCRTLSELFVSQKPRDAGELEFLNLTAFVQDPQCALLALKSKQAPEQHAGVVPLQGAAVHEPQWFKSVLTLVHDPEQHFGTVVLH